jgi:hypothetical protein
MTSNGLSASEVHEGIECRNGGIRSTSIERSFRVSRVELFFSIDGDIPYSL